MGVAVLAVVMVSYRSVATDAPSPAPSVRPAAGGSPLATLKILGNEVAVRKAGAPQYRVAKRGQALHQGDALRTDATGTAEIDYSDGSLTRLGPSTEFTITRLTNERGGRQTLGTLTVGETWNRAAKVSESGSFEITAGRTTAAVEGTAFAFSCTGPSTQRVCVVIDVVDNVKVMTTDGSLVQLTPGTSVTAANDVLGPPVHLSYEQLAGNPFIAQNLALDLQLGKGTGLGDLPGAPAPPVTSGAPASDSNLSSTLAPTSTTPTSTTPTTTTPTSSTTTAPALPQSTTTTTTTLSPTTTVAPSAPACRSGGYLALVGSQGQTFLTEQQCVDFVVGGGTFARGIIVPAGRTATFTSPTFSACDVLSYGYELNFDPVTQTTLGSKIEGCPDVHLANQTIGPFNHAVLIRVFLTDTGAPSLSAVCGDTFFSDGNHASVTGSNPWRVDIMDSAVCTSATNDPRPVPSPAGADFDVSLVLSPPA